jgi:hypothetical protein
LPPAICREPYGWSDHWSFWKENIPAVMVTDTALYRYPHFHTHTDTPEKIDYAGLARVVAGIERVAADVAENGLQAGKGNPSVPR